MAKYVALFVVVALCLQGSLAKKATQQAPVQKSQLEELSTVAQNVIQNITTTLGVQIPDSKQVTDIISNQTKNLASNVQDIANRLQGEVKAHQGDIDNVIKQVSEKLSETATQLQQAAGPDATAKAKELKDKFESGLKQAYEEVQKLVKAVEPDVKTAQQGVSNLAKNALDEIVRVGQNIQQQVQQVASDHEKSHQH